MDEYNKLLRKVQELEWENAELLQKVQQLRMSRLKRAGDRLCHFLNVLSGTQSLGSCNKKYIATLTQEWAKAKEVSK